MPVTTWPSELPQKQPIGLTISEDSTVVRFQPDVGAAKVRRRATTAPVAVSMPILLTGAQLATFDTFWANCWTQSGSLAGCFSWLDPRDNSTKIFRFRHTAKPRFTLAYPGSSVANTRWSANLDLEILP